MMTTIIAMSLIGDPKEISLNSQRRRKENKVLLKQNLASLKRSSNDVRSRKRT